MQGWKTNALLGVTAGLLLLPGAARAGGAEKTAPQSSMRQQVIVLNDEGKSDKAIDSIAKKVARGYLGVGLLDLTPELRTHFGVPDDAGVMVSKVESGSPAEKSGIKVGDILTGLDGKPVVTSFDLRQRVRGAEEGTQSTLEVWRQGKVQTLSATLEKRERQEYDLAPLFFKKDGNRVFLHLDGEDAGAMPFKIESGRTVPMQRLQGREVDLEKRLKQLEGRIKELEHQLEKQQH